MDFEEDEKIRATLFYHLRRKRIIGAKHTHYDTLKRGFPSHLGKKVKGIADELIREKFIVAKPTSYGLQVSLNKERIPEIEEYIKKVLDLHFEN